MLPIDSVLLKSKKFGSILNSFSMSSRGENETSSLRKNIEDQLNRLLTQLADLEEMKGELDVDEYNSVRSETIEQMKEFEVYLNKLLSGNITLIDQFGCVQLAIQTAIRNAFKSPEVVRMFAKKENGALRSKLASCDQDLKLGKITLQVYNDMTGNDFLFSQFN